MAYSKLETWLDEYSKIVLEEEGGNCIFSEIGIDREGRSYNSFTILSKKEALEIFKGFVSFLEGNATLLR